MLLTTYVSLWIGIAATGPVVSLNSDDANWGPDNWVRYPNQSVFDSPIGLLWKPAWRIDFMIRPRFWEGETAAALREMNNF